MYDEVTIADLRKRVSDLARQIDNLARREYTAGSATLPDNITIYSGTPAAGNITYWSGAGTVADTGIGTSVLAVLGSPVQYTGAPSAGQIPYWTGNGTIAAWTVGTSSLALLGTPNTFTQNNVFASTATSGTSFAVTRNLTAASTNAPVVSIVQDHGSDDQAALYIQQDGSGPAIFIPSGGGTAFMVDAFGTAWLNYGIRASNIDGIRFTDDAGNYGIYLADGGDVGIGGSPQAKFYVEDDTFNLGYFKRTNAGGAGFTLVNGNGVELNFGAGAGATQNFFAGLNGGADNFLYVLGSASGYLSLKSDAKMGFTNSTSSAVAAPDTYWYRNASNVLRTPGSVIVDGMVAIGTANALGMLHVDQDSTTAAIPTLLLEQRDLSEEFIEFASTVGAGNAIDTAAIGTYYGKIRVSITGVGSKFIALYNT